MRARSDPGKRSTSSPGASPASPSASPGSAPAATTRAGSGPPSPAPFAFYDPRSSSWRTSQGSLLTPGAWERFSGTWPPSGTTRSGRAFRRPRLVPRISGRGSGLWPTPRAYSKGTAGANAPGLTTLDIRVRGLYPDDPRYWPTPTRADARRAGNFGRGEGNPTLAGFVFMYPTPTRTSDQGQGKNRKAGLQLTTAVRYPTPQAGDWRSGTGASSTPGHAPQLRHLSGGQLNPTWVLWLMGCPLTWLHASPRETFSELCLYLRLYGASADVAPRLKRSVTRSSRRPPSGSGGGSSRPSRG